MSTFFIYYILIHWIWYIIKSYSYSEDVDFYESILRARNIALLWLICFGVLVVCSFSFFLRIYISDVGGYLVFSVFFMTSYLVFVISYFKTYSSYRIGRTKLKLLLSILFMPMGILCLKLDSKSKSSR